MYQTVSKTFQFHAAHRLLNHKGKCRNLHGHTYRIDVAVGAQLNDDPDASGYGMVIDFDELKKAWARIEPALDHRTLLQGNDPLVKVLQSINPEALGYLFEGPPTAENIAQHIYVSFRATLGAIYTVTQVTVWETPTSYATAS